VLHDIQRGALLVQPAREDAVPTLVELLNVELDEGAGIMFRLPWRGLLAGAEADDHVADARRLARLERHLTGDAVALVEQPEHRDAFGHRRRAIGGVGTLRQVDRRHVGRPAIVVERGMRRRPGIGIGGWRLLAPRGGKQRERRRRQHPAARIAHASGVHAS